MPSQPVILTAAKAAQEFADGTLPPTVEVEDTASQVARWLDSLQQIAHAGRLSSIQLTGGTTLLVVKAAQITSDAQALAKIAGPWKLVVKDTAADVTAALAVLETEAKAGRLSEIGLTDAGTPTLTLTAARASDFADALVTLFAADHLIVSDTASGVAAYLDGLQKIARAGRLTSVQLTGGTSLLTVKAAQVTSDAQALAKIAGAWKLVVKDTAANVNVALSVLETQAKAGRLSEIALTDSGTPTLTLTAVRASDFADALVTLFGADHLVVSDTAGGVALYLDGLQKIAHAGRLTSIQFTGSSTLVTVTVAQITADAQALGKIAGTYKLVVKDTAQNIAAALSFLNAPANRSRIYTIGLINPNSPITLTEDALNADAGALAKLAGTYSLDVTQVLAADATSIASMAHVATISVTDTAANVQAHLSQLEALSNCTINVTDVLAANATSTAAIAEVVTVSVTDSVANVTASLGALESIAKAGKLYGVVLTNPATALTLAAAELTSDAAALAKFPSSYSLDITGALAANATAIAANAHVVAISVTDSAANVQAHLAQLETLVETPPTGAPVASFSGPPPGPGGILTDITLTDSGTPVLTLTQSELVSDAGVLGVISSPFTLDVTGVLAGDVATLASNPLIQSLSVSDSAANVAANLGALETANAAGKIAGVDVSGAFVTTDISEAAWLLFEKFTVPQGFSVTAGGEEDWLSGGLVAFVTGAITLNFPVTLTLDKATVTPALITDLQNDLASGTIKSITGYFDFRLDDFSLQDFESITNPELLAMVQAADGLPLLAQTISMAQALPFYQAPISTLPISGALFGSIADSAANVQGGLDALTAALAGATFAKTIQLTDNLPPTISVSTAQAVNDAPILSAITTSYLLSIHGAAAQLNGLDLSALTTPRIELAFANLNENVTLGGAGVYDLDLAQLAVTGGATISAYSSGGQTGAEIDLTGTDGLAHKIILIGATPTSFILYAPLDNGMTLGQGSNLTGVLAANAEIDAAYTDVDSVAVSDTAAQVASKLNQLEEVFKAGKLAGVSLTDSGTPVLTLTQSELVSDAGVLGVISSPFTLDVTGVLAGDVATLASNPLIQSLSVSDSAANVAANLGALETANAAGKIAGVDVSGAFVTTDISEAAWLLFEKFTVPQGFSVTAGGEEDWLSGGLVAFVTGAITLNFPVTLTLDKATVTPALITDLQNDLASGTIKSITGYFDFRLDDFSLQDFESITNPELLAMVQAADGLPLLAQTISMAQALPFYQAPISTLPISGALFGSIADSAANVQGGLDALTAALAGATFAKTIQLTDNLPPTISVSTAQAVNDAPILSAITTSYLLSIHGAAAQLNGLDLSALTTPRIELAFANLNENVTLGGAGVYDLDLAQLAVTGGATISAYSSGGQTGAEIDLTGTDGLAHKIILIGATPTSFILYAPLDNGMTLGQGSNLTGVLAANAEIDAAYTDVDSVAVSDTAAQVASKLNQLEEVFKAGKLAGVSLTDSGTPVLTLTQSELVSDAGVLGVISSPFTLDVTGVLAGDVATLASNPLIQSLSVSDSAANVAANLGALETANAAGKIAGVDVSGAFVTTDISEAAWLLFEKFTVPQGFSVTAGGEEDWLSGGLVAFVTGAITLNFPVTLTLDKATVTPALITDLQNDLASGTIKSITGYFDFRLDDFSLQDFESITNPELLAMVQAADGLPLLAQTISMAQALPFYQAPISTLPISGALFGSIADSAANVQGGLDALTAALAGATFAKTIQLTDNLPPTISVSTAQAVNDAPILSAITTSYLLSIHGAAAQLNGLDLSALTTPRIELAFANLNENVTLGGAGVYDLDLAQLAVTGGATISAYSSGGQTGAEIDLTGTDGLAHKIILIGATPTSFILYAPLDNGMTLGQGSNLTGVLAANAEIDAAYTDVDSVAVSDTGANIVSDLGQLEEVFKAGKLTGVSIASGTLGTISSSEIFADADVIRLISNTPSGAADIAAATLWMHEAAHPTTGSAMPRHATEHRFIAAMAGLGAAAANSTAFGEIWTMPPGILAVGHLASLS